MNFINDFNNGDVINGNYLCKSKQLRVSTAGKDFINVTLQDKTGTIEAKIWDPTDSNIRDFNVMDVVAISGIVNLYNGNLQLKINSINVAAEGSYDIADFSPTTDKDIDEMYNELISYIKTIKNEHYIKLLADFFLNNEKFISRFKMSSAAKTVHHATIGGLVEHTLSVTKLCDFMCTQYPTLNRDLLITAAMCHDIGKVKELSAFPENDYTDDGDLLGHIYMGTELINEHARKIEGFPKTLLSQLKHCILAHHGELEYGSPKKPALIEALALTMADNIDAKLNRFSTLLNDDKLELWSEKSDYFLETKYRKTL